MVFFLLLFYSYMLCSRYFFFSLSTLHSLKRWSKSFVLASVFNKVFSLFMDFVRLLLYFCCFHRKVFRSSVAPWSFTFISRFSWVRSSISNFPSFISIILRSSYNKMMIISQVIHCMSRCMLPSYTISCVYKHFPSTLCWTHTFHQFP